MKRMFVPFFLLFTAAFVAGGVLLAFEQDLWALVVFGALVVIAVADMVLFTFRIGRGDRRLARRTDTRRGRATVLEAQELPLTLHMGGTVYQPRAFRLRLRVEVPDVEPYEVDHLAAARPWDVDHIRPGNVIECRVHPRRPRKLVLVFPEGTTPYGVSDAAAGIPTGDEQLARLIRESTGMDVREVADKVAAGEEVPGIEVRHGAGAAPVGAAPVGAPATAVVQGLQDLGATATGTRLVELDLLVHAVGEAPYRVVLEAELAPDAIPGLGRTIPVEVDPRRPARVRLSPS